MSSDVGRRYSAEERARAMDVLRTDGMAAAVAASGVSASTLRRWDREARGQTKPINPRSKVQPGTPGPAPLVLRGFEWHQPTDGRSGVGSWHPQSPAGEVLAALSIGATWEHAGHYARLHEATAREWNQRGARLLDGSGLDQFAAGDPTTEELALAAFHIAAAEARGAPVVGALQQIDRARRGGDVRAAVLQLRHLPQASPYRETTRTEVTGAEGGAVELTFEERAARLVAEAAALQAGEPGEG